MLPHVDTTQNNQLAIVHYLCNNEHGGTSFYRHKASQFEVISAERLVGYSKQLKKEAMANQIPVIATDVGGNPKLVLPNQTGWLFDYDDEEQLAKIPDQSRLGNNFMVGDLEFADLNKVKRHQKVYATVNEVIVSGELHALTLVALTPEEKLAANQLAG